MDSDNTLAAMAAGGNWHAFDELVRRHRPSLHRLVRTLIRDDAAAEDIVQDSFVRALRGLSAFRGDSAFRTWLHRIAINVVRSHVASRRSRPDVVFVDAIGDESSPVFGDIAAPLDLERTLIHRRTIERALMTLSADTRRVVALRDIHGFEYQEIAVAMNVPIGTVESRLFRGRRKLRPLLAELRGPDRRGSL